MRKIPTVFVRDFDRDPRHVTRDVTPGCEWVLAGEGVATRKWDGTCVMLDHDGLWWARREVRRNKPVPQGFVRVELDTITDKQVGWEPIDQSPFARFHAEALGEDIPADPGTYELLGPRVNGNPEGFGRHRLVRHGWTAPDELADLRGAPRDFDGLHGWLAARDYEGVVWHQPDGSMAKLKRADFPVESAAPYQRRP